MQKLAEQVKEETGEDTINDQARDYFRLMEENDPTAMALWKRFRDLSITKYHEIYDRLNVRFDVYSGESLYGEGMKVILKALEEKGITQDDGGASIIDLGNLGKTIVRKKNGAYFWRESGRMY